MAYVTKATTKGGRNGRAMLDNGGLALAMGLPKEMGGAGEGHNPEQLFALGWSACFGQAVLALAKPGSVVIDLAGETGGNCELTEPGKTVVKHGVTIASPLNLPATMPEHASELYAKNITALLDLLIKDGVLAPDFGDEVVAASCVTREREA